MGLWVEHRSEDGVLVASVRFLLGQADIGGGLVLTVDQARQLARHSAHVPLSRRDWALRVLGPADELDRPVIRRTEDGDAT